MSNLITNLFKTNAIKMCPDNKPFWYTSGKIGPYYINSEFLYGSEQDSKNLLAFIDEEKDDLMTLPNKLFQKILNQYQNNVIFSDLISEMMTLISEKIDVSEVDYISGGERRDWFFSYIIANLLNKPHITIYKDLSLVVSDSNFINTSECTDLTGKKVLHIADLITEAASYTRAWIPAINSVNATIIWSVSVIDRLQGGTEKLKEAEIKSYSAAYVDVSLFTRALDMGIINNSQFEMVENFLKNPDATMRDFLIAHPEFLENALASDEKTAARAKLCIDENLYNL